MKALAKLKTGYGNLSLIDIKDSECQDDQVKIKVKYSGICGSDIHTYKGEYNKNHKVPLILGHEFSGEVVKIGKDVHGIRIGEQVTSETTFYICGHCCYCETMDYNLCPSRKGLGTQVDGSFAEYVVARAESVHVLPENIDLLSAAMTEPLACCVHGVIEKGHVTAGDTVLVSGPGTMGLLAALVAKACGATVIISGTGRQEYRLELALKLGVDKTVNLQKEDLAAVVAESTKGYGVDKVIECSGSVSALTSAVELVRNKGTIVQIGLFAKTCNPIDNNTIFNKEICYIGSRTSKPSSWVTSLDLMSQGKVNVKALVTDIFKLEEWETGFKKVSDGEGIKIVLEP
jgi:L-iditol 2-dehydrogenase